VGGATIPIVADYGIITDEQFRLSTTSGGGSKQINFDLPDPPHGSRRILMFNIDLIDADDYTLEVTVNGTMVFKATYNGGAFFSIHEVIPKGLSELHQTQNWILFTAGGSGSAKIGDVVIFYQRQI
jgi:hypothetical protein